MNNENIVYFKANSFIDSTGYNSITVKNLEKSQIFKSVEEKIDINNLILTTNYFSYK